MLQLLMGVECEDIVFSLEQAQVGNCVHNNYVAS